MHKIGTNDLCEFTLNYISLLKECIVLKALILFCVTKNGNMTFQTS